MQRLRIAAVTLAVFALPAAARADVGQRKFNAKCASCHGKDGKGQTEMGQKYKVSDLGSRDVQAKLTDEAMLKQITDGNEAKKMPAFKDKLSEDEIKAVAAYVRTLAK